MGAVYIYKLSCSVCICARYPNSKST